MTLVIATVMCAFVYVCMCVNTHAYILGVKAQVIPLTHLKIHSNYQCVISPDTESLAFQDKIDSPLLIIQAVTFLLFKQK